MALYQGMTDNEAILRDILNCLRDLCFDDSAALQFVQTKSGNVSTAYAGFAKPGTDPSDTGWVIQLIVTDDDGSGNITTTRTWAATDSDSADWLVYNKTFADRATYVYS